VERTMTFVYRRMSSASELYGDDRPEPQSDCKPRCSASHGVNCILVHPRITDEGLRGAQPSRGQAQLKEVE
jgi:hypothetical protein